VKPLPVKEMKFYKSLSIALSLEGSYHQIGNMIAEMENAQYYLRVDKLELASQVKEKEGEKYTPFAKDGNTLLKCEMIVSTLIPSI
jgi:Tfp pilus assembly protein PilO